MILVDWQVQQWIRMDHRMVWVNTVIGRGNNGSTICTVYLTSL